MSRWILIAAVVLLLLAVFGKWEITFFEEVDQNGDRK